MSATGRRAALFVVLLSALVAVGCTSDTAEQGSSTTGGPTFSATGLTFGDAPEPCAPTVVDNGPDEPGVAAGAECFFAEYEAGRPATWDIRDLTVEGDAIPVRYQYDGGGTAVTITWDFTRDTFGSERVIVRVCERVVRSERLPKGVDCAQVSGPGFDSASLPQP